MSTNELVFTGEYFVPGKCDPRIEADHIERYRFARPSVAGKTVLDIASGAGYAGPIFVEAGAASYLGVDINPGLVKSATSTYGSAKISYVQGDIARFKAAQPFDVISCFETIEHVSDYRGALENLFRLLAPGGELFISSPNRNVTSPSAVTIAEKPENPFHVHEFLPEELLAELIAAGFIATSADAFGQRQSHVPRNRLLRLLNRVILGDPKRTASPVVTPLDGRTPRYFLFRATKPVS